MIVLWHSSPLVMTFWVQVFYQTRQAFSRTIANLLRTNWKKLGPLVSGKIHLTGGTADTFHLDEPARLLEQTIKDLGGNADFTHIEGRNHFDLYQGGSSERIAKEMYEVARPTNGSAQKQK